MAVLAKEHNENKLFEKKKQIIIITGDRDEVGFGFIVHYVICKTHGPWIFFKIFNGVLTGIFMFILLTWNDFCCQCFYFIILYWNSLWLLNGKLRNNKYSLFVSFAIKRH